MKTDPAQHILMSEDTLSESTDTRWVGPHGLILFAHGARDPRWAAPFEAVAQQIRLLSPQIEVRLAFLEFMSPDLQSAGMDLAARGCQTVDVLPMFLGAGGHVRKDLPERLESLRTQAPQVRWQLRTAIGEAPEIIEAMARHAVGHARRAITP